MTHAASSQLPASDAVGAPPPPRIWGHDATSLHALFWAARGLMPVLPGTAPPDGADRGPWLLLEDAHLVVVDLPGFLTGHRTRPLGTHAITVVDQRAASCREQVEADDDGRLLHLERAYAPPKRTERMLVVTDDPAIARRWAQSDPARGARARRRIARKARSNHRRAGCLYPPDDTAAVSQGMLAMLSAWRGPCSLGGDELQPGVHVGSGVVLPSSARLVSPVWIGHRVTIPDDAAVIGPCVYLDRAIAGAPAAPVRARSETELWSQPPRRRRGLEAIDRAANIAFALGALALTAPLLPLIALAIWVEDGGPVLFRHARQTTNGRTFTCHKFRTMCRDAERHRGALEARNICDGPQFHIEDDPRLLRVGRILRRFHLDELPQFLDVLRGAMNVVGPRPSPDHENRYCPAWREARLSVRPGLTGLWQVSRTRSPQSDFQEWIRYDLEYVERRSLGLDAWIVWRTMVNIAARMWRGSIGAIGRRRRAAGAHEVPATPETRSTLERIARPTNPAAPDEGRAAA